MKRASVHGLFTLVTLTLAASALWNLWGLYQHKKIATALAGVPDTILEVPVLEEKPAAAHSHPLLKLAQASALSSGGQFEAAESLFVEIIDDQQGLPPGQAARFNLANHYLRQGSRTDLPGGETRPLLEIAKQRYRDLLQSAPMDWGARYNLERALALAPERPEADPDVGPPPKSVRVIVPDFEADNLP